jgi:hypothetical protein
MTKLIVEVEKPHGLPETAKKKLWWFLRILSEYKGGYSHMDGGGDWIGAFCEDEADLGLDTDTFNIAESFGLCNTTHNSDTDVSLTKITDKGRQALEKNSEYFGYRMRSGE